MKDVRFLQLTVGGSQYLCSEEHLERVLLVKKEDVFEPPYGPEHLLFLMPFKDTVIPLFGSRKFSAVGESFFVVIIKNLVDIAGLIVDEINKFVRIDDETTISSTLSFPVFMAEKSIQCDGKESYILNVRGLFEGKE